MIGFICAHNGAIHVLSDACSSPAPEKEPRDEDDAFASACLSFEDQGVWDRRLHLFRQSATFATNTST